MIHLKHTLHRVYLPSVFIAVRFKCQHKKINHPTTSNYVSISSSTLTFSSFTILLLLWLGLILRSGTMCALRIPAKFSSALAPSAIFRSSSGSRRDDRGAAWLLWFETWRFGGEVWIPTPPPICCCWCCVCRDRVSAVPFTTLRLTGGGLRSCCCCGLLWWWSCWFFKDDDAVFNIDALSSKSVALLPFDVTKRLVWLLERVWWLWWLPACEPTLSWVIMGARE